ncbi:SigE family RNA polymerase sigma factor [Streptomyces yangpuensis]|uniref:SigE family RNA polymerase sigma factor n=1 Tax=Streptomyces yangpuensis TaxID=1648182 RepID=A0ABY5PYV7_9ACTN|nr:MULTISPECIES: SigE family RNA polymerase sigma factor [Streptomyces]UUY48958.1 SigE family RNA polymerase sigma factor [Streptomyces yangpuensis]
MAEALLEVAVLPARAGIVPPRRDLRTSGGGLPVIVPVPRPGTPEVPARAAVPVPGGLVPAQRDNAGTDGNGKDETAQPTADVAADVAAQVVAGTTVDHLTATYQAHYRSLLGLAALLLDDTASCEDVVQEAFIRVHSARNRVRDREKTLAYLRQTVVNLSRSALRRRILGLKLLSKPMPDMASAEEGAYDQLERDDLIKAMRGLQRRQREVLVLRYFADMTESQVAETLGISLGSVKAYGSRGIAALRVAMEAAQS